MVLQSSHDVVKCIFQMLTADIIIILNILNGIFILVSPNRYILINKVIFLSCTALQDALYYHISSYKYKFKKNKKIHNFTESFTKNILMYQKPNLIIYIISNQLLLFGYTTKTFVVGTS